MSELLPAGVNRVLNAAQVHLALVPVPASDTVAGAPQQGTVTLGTLESVGAAAAGEVGIWELSAGCVTDIESDELFVVLSGSATIEFLTAAGDAGAAPPVTLGAGDVMRLVAGTRTRWTVHDHIRKVYISA